MTRWLVDTNIVSDAIQKVPLPAVARWFGAQPDQDLFIASLTLAEIARGILEMPASAKRQRLAAWFDGHTGPAQLFAGRILAFDANCADIWARMMADGKRKGRPRDALDTIIAAIAVANDCTVVTRNIRDFEGVPAFDPAA